MSDPDDWVEIVPPSPEPEAEALFRAWLGERIRKGFAIPADAVRRDLISRGPGGGGCLVAYQVRRSQA